MTGPPGREELQQMAAETLESVGPREEGGLVRAMSEFRGRLLQAADEGFDAGSSGLPCSWFLCGGHDRAVTHVARSAVATVPEAARLAVAWVATGGYGRGLMSPGSTVRLAVLHDGTDPEAAAAVAGRAADLLPKAGVQGACAAHTVPEVLQMMQSDYVSAVSMLETRMVTGDRALHEELQTGIAGRFLPDCWGSMGQEVLREALERRDPLTGSPYCTEPDLKEGAGGLRDIGAVQKLDAALAAIPELERHCREPGGGRSLISEDEHGLLEEALDFVLRVRNRLHFVGPDASDLLLRDLQPEVARALGFTDEPGQPAAAQLMRELFRRTGLVARLLQAVGERFSHLHRVAWRRSQQPPRRALGEGFVEVEGRIYGTVPAELTGPEGAQRTMRLFRLSQRRHLPVSQQLLDAVRKQLEVAGADFEQNEDLGRAFLDLLAGSVGVADRISWMRDCGLLQAFLPELAPLVHRAQPEVGGELTLDEHAIEALRVIDQLQRAREPGELAQRQVLEQVQRPDLLRLAVLLHDLPQVSEAPPAEAAGRIADRIGLQRSEKAELVFLVSHTNLLWVRAQEGDYHEASVVEELARTVSTPERLRMLYLLSYAHARAMGAGGWVSWWDARLSELYQSVMAALLPEHTPFATAEYLERRLKELAAREELSEEAERLVSLVPELYSTEVTAEEALTHVRMIGRLAQQPATMTRAVGDREATVWVCTSDVPARFAQIAGVFTHNGLDILSATAFTLTDGTVLDRFVVQMKGRPINPDPAFWRDVESDLVRSIEGQLDIRRELRRRAEETRRAEPISSRRL
ncbi:MAG: hypothetical protein PVJ27_06085, partial [Candidatus Brocadiaceae bacterium]